MYGYISWPGVYSFKEEIGMFMEYLREQIDEVMKKIEETEDLVADDYGYVKPVKDFLPAFCYFLSKTNELSLQSILILSPLTN